MTEQSDNEKLHAGIRNDRNTGITFETIPSSWNNSKPSGQYKTSVTDLTEYEMLGITNPSMSNRERFTAVQSYWKDRKPAKRDPQHVYGAIKPVSVGCNCDGAGWYILVMPSGGTTLTKCECGSAGPSPADRRLSRELDALSARDWENFDETRPMNATERNYFGTALSKAKRFSANPKGWLYIWGNPGAGKSHIAAAIANANKNRLSVVYRSMPAMIDLMREQVNGGSIETLINELRLCDVLILDDVSAESKITEWAEGRIFRLLQARDGLATVFTSNVDVHDLPFREHILDRLNVASRCWLPLTSYRKEQQV